MDNFRGGVAVVTGAGSGIGRAIAMQCAREGMHVAVADVMASRLTSLEEELKAEGVNVLARELDLHIATYTCVG